MSERTETTTGQHCGHIACLGMSYCTLTRPDLPAPDERQAGRGAFVRMLEGYADRAHDNDRGRAMVPEVVLRDAAAIIEEQRALTVAQVPAQEEVTHEQWVARFPASAGEGLQQDEERKLRESVAVIAAMEQETGADEWTLHWSNGVVARLLATLDAARAALPAQVPAQEERLDVERLVANHLMRAGWLRRDDMALREAHRIVLTVRTGLRWDLDDDQLTPEHRRALGVESMPPGVTDPQVELLKELRRTDYAALGVESKEEGAGDG